MFVYCLKLVQGKYYVGLTSNVKRRVSQHINGRGSCWTLKYKPIRLIESFRGDGFTENMMTKKYMSIYGIKNVRGGAYSQIVISKDVQGFLEHEVTSSLGWMLQVW